MSNWFYSTKLGYKVLLFMTIRKQNRFEEEFASTFSSRATVELAQDSVMQKYQEGLLVLKSKVKKNDFNLNEEDELLSLAKEETEEQKKFREVMERIYVNKGQDIKDEVEKRQMIDKRIRDFYTLQKYNEERELIKKIKQAVKSGDKDLAERLEHDWKQRFRPSIH